MIVVYLKVTNYCNVGCEFCYLPEESREDKRFMTEKTLIASAKLIGDMSVIQGKPVMVIYHGGEPLTLSPGRLERISDLVKENIGPVDLTEAIQTSLIPFNEKYLDFIHSRCESMIGSSVDFSGRSLNGSVRKYQDLWLKKVTIARDHGIDVGPIIVPSKDDLAKAKRIVNFFIKNDFSYFSIDRYSDIKGNDKKMPTNKEFALFLIELTKELLDKFQEGVILHCNVVSAAIRGILYSQPGDRWGGSCQSDFVVINPDGSTNSCPDRIEHEAPFSNVEDGVSSFLGSADRLRWVQVQNNTQDNRHCRTCRYNQWCKSGCPIVEKIDSSGECSGYYSYLSYIEKIPREVLEGYLNGNLTSVIKEISNGYKH